LPTINLYLTYQLNRIWPQLLWLFNYDSFCLTVFIPAWI
jgi:hypothetical protein